MDYEIIEICFLSIWSEKSLEYKFKEDPYQEEEYIMKSELHKLKSYYLTSYDQAQDYSY